MILSVFFILVFVASNWIKKKTGCRCRLSDRLLLLVNFIFLLSESWTVCWNFYLPTVIFKPKTPAQDRSVINWPVVSVLLRLNGLQYRKEDLWDRKGRLVMIKECQYLCYDVEISYQLTFDRDVLSTETYNVHWDFTRTINLYWEQKNHIWLITLFFWAIL